LNFFSPIVLTDDHPDTTKGHDEVNINREHLVFPSVIEDGPNNQKNAKKITYAKLIDDETKFRRVGLKSYFKPKQEPLDR
jgi:hypothetical protein